MFSSELPSIVVLVKAELGPLWEILSSEEQKHLAIGLRSMDDQHLHRFAGLSLGLAVETSLSEFLFERLRSHLQDQQAGEIPIDDSEDYLEPIVTRFFNRPSDHLMLGQMVGAFNRVVHFKAPSPRPVGRLLTDYLSGLPRVQLLFVRDESVRSLRRRALNRINDIRVRCAHPKNLPDKADLDCLWKHVVSDPDHAFFHYFRGAFLAISIP